MNCLVISSRIVSTRRIRQCTAGIIVVAVALSSSALLRETLAFKEYVERVDAVFGAEKPVYLSD